MQKTALYFHVLQRMWCLITVIGTKKDGLHTRVTCVTRPLAISMNDTHLSEDVAEPNQPALAAANEALAEMRISFDSSPGARSPSPVHVNGFLENGMVNGNGDSEKNAHGSDPSVDIVQTLRDELLRTKQENETLTTKYNNLVAKLTTMRNSVESKLKRDAVSVPPIFLRPPFVKLRPGRA